MRFTFYDCCYATGTLPCGRRVMEYASVGSDAVTVQELFQFLEDDDHMPKGGASADRLAVELTAGGLTPEHTKFVLKKFNREGRGVVDFLDFVTYVPLFVLIHKRIISDPLREELDL